MNRFNKELKRSRLSACWLTRISLYSRCTRARYERGVSGGDSGGDSGATYSSFLGARGRRSTGFGGGGGSTGGVAMGARGARGRCSTGASAGGASFGLLREPGGLPRPRFTGGVSTATSAGSSTAAGSSGGVSLGDAGVSPTGFALHYPLGLIRLAFSENPFNQNRSRRTTDDANSRYSLYNR